MKNLIPDRNLVLFKKANNTLFESIKTLVNSDEYYADGSLAMMGRGGRVKSPTYFCETLSKTLNTKSVNCSSTKTSAEGFERVLVVHCAAQNLLGDNVIVNTEKVECPPTIMDDSLANMDYYCRISAQKTKEEIILKDGAIFYQTQPAYTFYDLHKRNKENLNDSYKILCVDIDGINKGENPFSYGVRQDGDIIPGCKAQKWLDRNPKDRIKTNELDCPERIMI